MKRRVRELKPKGKKQKLQLLAGNQFVRGL